MIQLERIIQEAVAISSNPIPLHHSTVYPPAHKKAFTEAVRASPNGPYHWNDAARILPEV